MRAAAGVEVVALDPLPGKEQELLLHGFTCPPCAIMASMRANPPWPPCVRTGRGCAWDEGEGEGWSGA